MKYSGMVILLDAEKFGEKNYLDIISLLNFDIIIHSLIGFSLNKFLGYYILPCNET